MKPAKSKHIIYYTEMYAMLPGGMNELLDEGAVGTGGITIFWCFIAGVKESEDNKRKLNNYKCSLLIGK